MTSPVGGSFGSIFPGIIFEFRSESTIKDLLDVVVGIFRIRLSWANFLSSLAKSEKGQTSTIDLK